MTSAKKIFTGYNKLSVYLAVIFIVNIFFLRLPLLNMPGFELSVANSILLVVLSGIFSIGYLTKRTLSKSTIFPIPYQAFLLFIILPLAISVFNSFFTMMCSLKEGLLFYLVFTLPAVFIGYSLGLFCVAFIKKFRIIAFIVLVILIVLIPLVEFYFNPQVYFFNPVFGYFPGTIYDEGIRISTKIISYRIVNLLYFFIMAFLSWNLYSGSSGLNKKLSFFTIFIIPVLFIFSSPYFGYSTTNSRIQHVLSKEVVTNHFKIFYPASLSDIRAKEITIEHEYQYQKLKSFFGYDPDEKITSYVFASSYQKGEYFGSANADVAKPWLNQIYISVNSYDQTLRHELAHVFSAKYGTGILKVADNFNPALIEGIAVAADPYYADNTIDYMAALAYKNGFKIKIESLFRGLNFFGKVSSISYIYAGSFSKFLIDNYGIKKYSEYYSDMNFENIYGEKLSVVAGKYYNYLENYNISPGKAKAYYYFGRRTIFQKVCPRYIADRLEDGWDAYVKREYPKSEKIFNEILSKTANYSALIGLSENYSAQKKNEAASELLANWINKFSNTAYYYNLELKLADHYVLSGKSEIADSLYRVLSVQKPNRTMGYISSLRLFLSNQPGLLYKYLSADDTSKFKILIKINAGKYLYSSFPVLINLAERLDVDYSSFISEFGRGFMDNSYECSYSFYKLSGYMLENSDFENARKLAALAMEYDADGNYNEILRRNFDKSVWIDYNAKEILNNLKINNTE